MTQGPEGPQGQDAKIIYLQTGYAGDLPQVGGDLPMPESTDPDTSLRRALMAIGPDDRVVELPSSDDGEQRWAVRSPDGFTLFSSDGKGSTDVTYVVLADKASAGDDAQIGSEPESTTPRREYTRGGLRLVHSAGSIATHKKQPPK